MPREYTVESRLAIIFRALADAFLSLATVPHVELFPRHYPTRTA